MKLYHILMVVLLLACEKESFDSGYESFNEFAKMKLTERDEEYIVLIQRERQTVKTSKGNLIIKLDSLWKTTYDSSPQYPFLKEYSVINASISLILNMDTLHVIYHGTREYGTIEKVTDCRTYYDPIYYQVIQKCPDCRLEMTTTENFRMGFTKLFFRGYSPWYFENKDNLQAAIDANEIRCFLALQNNCPPLK